MDKETRKYWAKVIFAAVVLYWALCHYEVLLGRAGSILLLFLPFMIGGCIAFILNIPMRSIEQGLSGLGKKKGMGFLRKHVRVIAIVLTYFLTGVFLFCIAGFVVPEILDTVYGLGANLQGMLGDLQKYVQDGSRIYDNLALWIDGAGLDWEGIGQNLGSGFKALFDTTVSVAMTTISGIINIFLAVVFSIYVLTEKENLARQARKALHVFLGRSRAEKWLELGQLTNRTFSSFVLGQCREAVILGLMFLAAMMIFRFPYALLISVLIAFTALIPVFGAFIGCAAGMLLIGVSNPMQAVWFLALFLVLQQIEGNVIYPRVVGNSVGLPAIWVLVAVTVGGSLMGIVGMLLFIPLVSVLYAVFRGYVNKRMEEKTRISDKGVEK